MVISAMFNEHLVRNMKKQVSTMLFCCRLLLLLRPAASLLPLLNQRR